MNSTDKILINLYSGSNIQVDKEVPARDRKILFSLFRQITAGHFLTENQAKLLVKIFKENLSLLKLENEEMLNLIENPVWSESFRKIEQVKKLYISDQVEKNIVIEFTYNKRVRDQFSKMAQQLDGSIVSIGNKKHSVPLTEKNVVTLVQGLKKFNFEVDQEIAKFYQEISEILSSKEDVFNIANIENKKLLECLVNDIGIENKDNSLLLHDRKLRYQYSVSSKITPENLTAKLATRSSPRVFVNKEKYSLDQIIESLIALKRLPVLFIFSGHDSNESYDDLQILASALENQSIKNSVGIYFRFDNVNNKNKDFNESITQLKYNAKLASDTKVVGLANNKLPKFILREQWKPSSIVSFTNNFKNNKTSVYCDNVDLVVYYHNREPLGDINVIV